MNVLTIDRVRWNGGNSIDPSVWKLMDFVSVYDPSGMVGTEGSYEVLKNRLNGKMGTHSPKEFRALVQECERHRGI